MSRTTYAYDLRGNIVKKTLGNGLVEKRTYDGRNRVTTLKNQTAGGTDIAGSAYSYDRAGNVMEVVEDYPDGSLTVKGDRHLFLPPFFFHAIGL